VDDVKRAIAFLFRRAGAVEVPEKDLLLAVSLDLRWFNYTTAARGAGSAWRSRRPPLRCR